MVKNCLLILSIVLITSVQSIYFYMEPGQERCFKDEVVKNYVGNLFICHLSISLFSRLLKWSLMSQIVKLFTTINKICKNKSMEYSFQFSMVIQSSCIKEQFGQTISMNMTLIKVESILCAFSLLIQCSLKVSTRLKPKLSLQVIFIEIGRNKRRARRCTMLKRNKKLRTSPVSNKVTLHPLEEE